MQYDQLQRRVYLLRGETIFDVAHEQGRVFEVDAGVARVTVLGTRFALTWEEQGLRVSVERGAVRVANEGGEQVLGVGQVAGVTRDGPPRLLPITATPSRSSAVAWSLSRQVSKRSPAACPATVRNRSAYSPARAGH